MDNITLFLKLRVAIIRNWLGKLRTESRLKSIVILCFAVGFWGLIFYMFYDVFTFVDKFAGVKMVLLDYLFSFFFIALLIMMTISNGIITYSALFRSGESQYLLGLPVKPGVIFSYKSFESLMFSSWGLLTILVPMILAYGVTSYKTVSPVSLFFYPASLLFSVVFVFLPTSFGALCALLLTAYFPRKRRGLIVGLCVVAGIAAVYFGWTIFQKVRGNLFSESSVKNILDRIQFTQHWLLPSRWTAEGILASSRGDLKRSGFYFLVLVSNVLFFGTIAGKLGGRLYGKAWALSQSHSNRKYVRTDGAMDRFLIRALFFIPLRMRYLVRKDLKTFLRDPAQWSQFLLFFGLLALYIFNLPRMGYLIERSYWRGLIAFMNLAATCLTMSTFTSRFVFPQLSLEGKRFWILGLLPVRQSTILVSKFFFSATGSFLISGPLITASDLVLKLPWPIIVLHVFVVMVCCCGLSGLSVGLGALYPDLKSENPSKIVSSFGGTLNLVLSIGYVTVTVGLVAIPMMAYARETLNASQLNRVLVFILAAELLIGTIATLVPLRVGLRAFRKMEF